jgi:predicted GNAT family acetyltransferase
MAESALRALDQAYLMGIGQGPAPERVPRTRGQTAADILGAASLPMSAVPIAGDITGLAADAAMYAAYPEERTMGNYAMSALGVLPLVPGVSALRALRDAPDAASNTKSSDSRAYQLAEDSDEDGLYSITAYTDDDAFVVADANTDGTFSIKESGVPEQLRGTGVGIGLYESLLGDAFKRGAPRVASDVSVSKEAQRIYSALQRRGYNVQQNPNAVVDPESGALFAEGGVYTIMPASAAPSPLEGTIDSGLVTRQLGGTKVEIRDPANPGLRLTLASDPEEGPFMSPYLEILGDKEQIGGRGTATKLYLEGLARAQAGGLGWQSDSILSDSSYKMYDRLKNLGVPFSEATVGPKYSISAADLANVDINRMQSNFLGRQSPSPLQGTLDMSKRRPN